MKYLKHSGIAITLCVVMFLQACGGSFAGQLRVILAASGPLVDALPLSPALKSGLIVDFTELANGAAQLKTEIDACTAKPCKLGAVERYEQLFERVEARGHFGSHQRLQQIEGILRGIIASAKIFYGGTTGMESIQAKSLDEQLKDLKAAMKP